MRVLQCDGPKHVSRAHSEVFSSWERGSRHAPKKSRRVQDRGFKMCEEAETHHKVMQRLLALHPASGALEN